MSLLAPLVHFLRFPLFSRPSARRRLRQAIFPGPTEVTSVRPGLTVVGDDEKTWLDGVIARVIAGDTEAFREIVLHFQHRVHSIIWRQVRQRDVAEELAQDVFVRAFRHLGSYRGDSSFSTWLIRISLNVVKSHFTSRRYRESLRCLPFPFDRLHDLPAQDAGAVTEKERAEAVRLAVERLPEKYRRVVVLCSFEGMSYREAADVLELPLGTVCSRMNVALQKLKQQLGSES
ncbi:MAG: sigma-70 family RNA polymerase sigma factor [Deltaproteobacteria bacterium]|nr:sigma-70 family RNA polymerase sigma factor [Deltaproteobacteria bacterium]